VIEREVEGNGFVPMLHAVNAAITAGEIEHETHTMADVAAVFDVLDDIRSQLAAATGSADQ
jgi:hypothetical protein